LNDEMLLACEKAKRRHAFRYSRLENAKGADMRQTIMCALSEMHLLQSLLNPIEYMFGYHEQHHHYSTKYYLTLTLLLSPSIQCNQGALKSQVGEISHSLFPEVSITINILLNSDDTVLQYLDATKAQEFWDQMDWLAHNIGVEGVPDHDDFYSLKARVRALDGIDG